MWDFADNAALDLFPTGCMITDADRNIVYVNAYFHEVLGWSRGQIVGHSLDRVLTRASRIFYESCVFPILISQQRCPEAVLMLRRQDGASVTVSASLRVHPSQPDRVLWSVAAAQSLDKLHTELGDARRDIEQKTARLRRLSTIDELTGLLNRRELLQRAESAILQSRTQAAPLAAMLLDIDHFKTINDQHGHLSGDAALRDFGALLTAQARAEDIVGRYGGEEFLIVLPGENSMSAAALAKQLLTRVRALQVETLSMTVSIGISELLSAPDDCLKNLLERADVALYHAKQGGRDRSVTYAAAIRVAEPSEDQLVRRARS